MRHRVYGKHLGRDKNQRTALFKSLVQSLVLSESIQTTEAKAKAVKGLVDKIITQAKSPTTRRLVSQFLIKKEVSEKLIKTLLPRLQGRNSGYTSVVKLGRRAGDGAMVVKMSLLLDEAKGTDATKATKESKVAKETEVIEGEVVSEVPADGVEKKAVKKAAVKKEEK